MSNALLRHFISDLHLDASRPDLTQAFFNYLTQQALLADELYILGDFFELWLGDDDHTEFNQSIIDALAAYPMPIYLMHGNRDFLIGEAFCQAIGATLLLDPSVIQSGSQAILLMHGDSLCTEDTEYMKARVLLRDPAFQADFLSKSLDERSVFAQAIRQQSKDDTRQKAMDIMDVTPSEVSRLMSKSNVGVMIHGHTHRPMVHDLTLEDGTAAKRYVLGDWDKQLWYIDAVDEDITLHQVDI